MYHRDEVQVHNRLLMPEHERVEIWLSRRMRMKIINATMYFSTSAQRWFPIPK